MSKIFETDGTGVDFLDVDLSGDFTLEFNVYISPTSSPTDENPIFVGSDENGNEIVIHMQDGRPTVSTSNRGDILVSPNELAVGEWHSIALVRGPGNNRIKLFIDGISEAGSGTGILGDVSFTHFAESNTSGFSGRLDEIRIWDSALSATDILANAGQPLDLSQGVPTSLLRYYNFDTDNDHIVDLTGNAEQNHDLHLPANTSIIDDPSASEIQVGDVQGFIDTQIATGLFLPTDIEFLPDGRMLVLQKNGHIYIYEDPTVANSPSALYMDISSITLEDREAGLLNIELDPDFANNGYFYLMYTNSGDPNVEGSANTPADERTTVSRFQHVENGGGATSRGDISTEQVLWREHDFYNYADHQGGGMAIAYEPIGPDDPSPYKLYIAVGEEFIPENSQDLTHDDGKLHRVNLTDGSIPTDNPYYDPIAAANYTPDIHTLSAISTSAENLALDPEGVITTIYSYGLRNPWRAEYDDESQTLFIGEVGGGLQTSSEDIHVAVAGANMGWPGYEGYLLDASDPGNPIWAYTHVGGPGQDDLDLYGNLGAAIAGGVVYRGDQFPDEFGGVYFYGDWVRKWIRFLELDYSGDEPVVVSDNHFKNASGQVLSFKEGPDGSLYYISTFQTGNMFTFEGSVNRIFYSGSNLAPQGQGILLEPNELASTTWPHTVTFDTDAFDPDGDELTYAWSFGDGIDLDGDGIGDTATSTERSPTYVYNGPGDYRVELVVTDEHGAQTVYESQTISVGNAPVVTIDTPTDGMTFRVGDVISMTGSAVDVEDGVMSGTDVFWSMSLVHNEHGHPEFTAIENTTDGFSFEVAGTGHDYFTNVRYQILLTAIDSDGMTTTESIFIYPEESVTTYDNPDVAGYTFVLDGVTYSGDLVFDNIIGFNHVVTVPETYVDGGYYWNFSHWEDDVNLTTSTRAFVVPETDTTLRPIYVQGAPTQDVSANPDVIVISASALPDASVIELGNIYDNDNLNASDPAGLLELHGFKWNGNANVDNTFSSGYLGWIWADNGGKFRVYDDGRIEFHADNQFDDLASGESVTTSVSYVISNGTESSTAVISLTITGEGDPNSAPAGTGIVLDAGEDSSATAPYTVTFESDVTDAEGHAITYAWDFGDGNTATGAAPSHTYTDDGLYTVTLTATDELGASTTYTSVDIDVGNVPPVAVDDSVTLSQGFDPQASHLHILDNDYDPDGTLDMQMVEIVSGPTNGTIEIMDTEQELIDRGLPTGHYGHAEYVPTDANFVGSDSFTYRVRDSEGTWSNVATVTIDVVEPSIGGTQALSLDGTEGVDVQDFSLGEGGSDFTIEGWVTFTSGPINNVDGIAGSGTNWRNGNDINFYNGFARLYDSDYGDLVTATTAVELNTPTHFAFVREDGIASLYINGVLDAEGTVAWTDAFDIQEIGWALKGGDAGLEGIVDEFRFWSDARTATEIADNYDQAIQTLDPDLVANYHFDGDLDDGNGATPLPDMPTGAEFVDTFMFA